MSPMASASQLLILVHYGSGSAFNPNQVVLSSFVSAVLPGDFNFDGKVDAADYVVWRKGLGTTHTPNGFGLWRAHFGQLAGSRTLSNASVPEPVSIWLLTVGAAVVPWTRCRIASQLPINHRLKRYRACSGAHG